MGNYYSEYEHWNTTGVNITMAFLLKRYDIFKYDKTKKIEPISKEQYGYLSKKMDGFLEWYKSNKNDYYMPVGGCQKMYSYDIISRVHKMNKKNKPIKSIMKVWNTRDENFMKYNLDNNEEYFRIKKKKLKSVPNDALLGFI